MGHQRCGVIHRNNKLVPTMEHHQVRSNHVPDKIHHAYQHDIVSPLDIIKTPLSSDQELDHNQHSTARREQLFRDWSHPQERQHG